MKFSQLEYFLNCKDHLVSGEEFDLLYNSEFDLLLTSPQPDAEKISRYYKSDAYISHTDSKNTWMEQLYQWAKNYMLKKKITLINFRHPKRGKLLDIGAGTGSFLITAREKGWNTYGIEPNETARKQAEQKGVFLCQNTESLQPKQFDVITLWHVLEHLPDLEKQLKNLFQLLKKDGTLVVAVPNYKSFDAKHYGKFWAAYDVPRHLWHFSKKSIGKLFNRFGFELVETLPLKLDSYYVSLLSEKYRHGKSRPLHAFWTGFRSNFKARTSKEYSSHIYLLKKRVF